ncbi:penicillin-binding protein activator [Alphaproteobacteria bacterium]|nr:penicillin-binding protein activator [Alphaproteobacteria bacterium]
MNGCQNTTEKIILENKISTVVQKKDKSVLNKKNFSKNKILKSKIILNKKEITIKQKDNDVIFEFRNERLLQGRDKSKFAEKTKTKKALSAVFKMLEQNLSTENNNLNLKSNGGISLDSRYFNIKKDAALYSNILAFLPLTGSYSNYGVKIRKALDLSVLNSVNNKIRITYFDTGKNINKKIINKLFNNINPSFIIGPFRREILLDIKPIAKSKFIPILTFSNDISLRENNIWSLGFSPEEQVESVISCALNYGYKNFGLVAPDNLYGRILTNASIDLIKDYNNNKYDKILLNNEQLNNKSKLFSILKNFLNFNENQTQHTRFDTILIGGSKEFILEIAPLLAFFNVDSTYVKILGTEKFNTKEIKNEPSLEKAWFPAIISKNDKDFRLYWKKVWGDDINYFSNAGYDSGNIGIKYVNKQKDGSRSLKNISGPITGLTLKSGGYVKKPINVMQIESLGKLTNIEQCSNFKG